MAVFIRSLLVLALLTAPGFAQGPYGPYKAELAEMTGDHCPDLVLGYLGAGTVIVEEGDCRSAFQRIAVNAYETQDGVGDRHVHNFDLLDVDIDGQKDLAAAIGGMDPQRPGTILVAQNVGGGELVERARFSIPSQAKGVRLGDFDGDGKVDLAATARGRDEEEDLSVGRLYLWPGLGDFKFGEPTFIEVGRSAYDIELADLNGDGFTDFVIPNERTETVHVVLNTGAALFSDPPEAYQVSVPPVPGYPGHHVNDVRAADFNDDGKMDLIGASYTSGIVAVWHGKGDGTFNSPGLLFAGENAAYIDLCDMTGTGTPDVAVTHWSEVYQTSIFINRGEDGFFPRQKYATGLGSYGATCADYDARGQSRILVTANYIDRSISLLEANGDGTFAPPVHWPRGIVFDGGHWVPESGQN